MKTLLFSVTGIEDGFFRAMWENMPTAGYAIASIIAIGFVIYKVMTFFTGLKQGLTDINNSLIDFKIQVAGTHTRMDKETAGIKERVNVVEVKQHALEMSVIKVDAKVDSLRQEMYLQFKEVNNRFDEMDKKFISIDRRFEAIDMRFEKLENKFDQKFEKFEEKFDQKFEKLEQKMDKKFDTIIDILLTQRDTNSLSLIRKSQ